MNRGEAVADEDRRRKLRAQKAEDNRLGFVCDHLLLLQTVLALLVRASSDLAHVQEPVAHENSDVTSRSELCRL